MGKSFIIILFCFLGLGLQAQDSLCVFKTSPGVIGKLNGKKRPLQKGDFLNDKSAVYVTAPSDITLINAEGDAFNIKNVGTYSYPNLLKYKAIEDQKSLTSKYFKLIWDELLKRDSGKTIIGGVFRGDVLMEFPGDSTKTASSKLKFSWQIESDTTQYFVFIKDVANDAIHKFATNGNELVLYKDNPIFAESDTFEWAVSTSEFPNLKNIPFYTFSLIERSEYEELKSSYSDLITDLRALGLSDSEVEDTLCQTYGFCK
ncbi:hypothetical protein [Winogradskyella tangerina]|uniref:hypothetical protein n=1 Tax=Winogradskyella tangerina TaxID=2023240 RepID=UPI000DBEA888|nr:hypothetical protein [Winogradskyella tangerina]